MPYPLSEFRATLDRCAALFARTPVDAVHKRRAPDHWTFCEIVGHLVDSASNNHQRFVRLRFGDLPGFPPYDPEAWVKAQDYDAADWDGLRELWSRYNDHLLRIVGRMDPAEPCGRHLWSHPEKSISLAELVPDHYRHLEWHIAHYVKRLEEFGIGG
jgi:hypothetical protein